MGAWFRFPSGLLKVLAVIAECLRLIVDRIADHEDIQQRVHELERSRALWDAEIEGRLAKIDQLFKATRGAEERTRAMLRRHSDELPEDDDEEVAAGTAYPASWNTADAAHASPVTGLQAMPPHMASGANARARKWGRG